MGIFDNLFKTKEKEEIFDNKYQEKVEIFDKNKEKVNAPIVNKDVNIYDEIKTLIKENKEVTIRNVTDLINYGKKYEKSFMFYGSIEGMKNLGLKFDEETLKNFEESVSEAIFVKENREDFKNFIVNIPFEYRSFNQNEFLIINDIIPFEYRSFNPNEFLIINDITSEQEIKLNNILDRFKDKVGTEWLSGFVDFMKEVNDMNLNNRDIKNKDFISNLNLEGNVFTENPIKKAYQITETSGTVFVNTILLTKKDSLNKEQFNKGDYIVEDKFENFINISKEDFEAKYKVIEKNSFENIIDETKKVLNDKSSEYNELKKELESSKLEIEKLKERLNGIENNFKSLS